MIALFQIDGRTTRPSEFSGLKLSNMDFDNQKLYLDDTKTGNNYIIMSPRLSEAIKNYIPMRKPLPEYEDYLVVVPNGRYKAKRLGEQVVYIKNLTKKLAVKAEIKKHVTPYIIKPSTITNDFNKNINPRIIQRMARHKNIETTLRYDHTDDLMVRKYFEDQELNIQDLSDSDKSRLLFQRFLKGEIDIDTYKRSLDFLHEKTRRHDNFGYA